MTTNRYLPGQHEPARSAFTLVDLAVMIGLLSLALVAIWLLAPCTGGKARPERINCVNNLKQAGLAFMQFAVDHNDRFPMEVRATNGGSMEFGGNVVQQFTVLSNELSEPRLLDCP